MKAIWLNDHDDDDTDDARLARQLQQEEYDRHKQGSHNHVVSSTTPSSAAASSSSLTPVSDSILILKRQVSELISQDPNPDIRILFRLYNHALFDNTLDAVAVEWSSRMKLIAGSCSYQSKSGYCRIGLSQPILQFRPLSDTLCTLLHEMIHAYLFVGTHNTDHSDHGPQFQFHMNRINKLLQLNITIYHSFHDEVDHYQTHIWRCDGPCRLKPPYHGWVKRSMNRAPGAYDSWFAEHQLTCGGTFTKVSSPELSPAELEKKRIREEKKEQKDKQEKVIKKQQSFMESFVKLPTASSTVASPTKRKRAPKTAVPIEEVDDDDLVDLTSDTEPSPTKKPKNHHASQLTLDQFASSTSSTLLTSSVAAAAASTSTSSRPPRNVDVLERRVSDAKLKYLNEQSKADLLISAKAHVKDKSTRPSLATASIFSSTSTAAKPSTTVIELDDDADWMAASASLISAEQLSREREEEEAFQMEVDQAPSPVSTTAETMKNNSKRESSPAAAEASTSTTSVASAPSLVILPNPYASQVDSWTTDPALRATLKRAQQTCVFLTNDDEIGSGTLISSTGLILTAAHCCEVKETPIQVELIDGSTFTAHIQRVSKTHDLALLQIDQLGSRRLPFAVTAKMPLKKNDLCVAVGQPFYARRTARRGDQRQRMEFGQITRVPPDPLYIEADQRGILYHNCNTSAGHSGCPLFNRSGEISGVHVTCDDHQQTAVTLEAIKQFLHEQQ